LARGEAGRNSDIDVLVELDPGRSLLDIIAIKQDLEDLIGCDVDVVTEATISPYISYKRPSQDLRSQHYEIPWRRIAGLRDV
jgi:predicted nucleotidyltransferase